MKKLLFAYYLGCQFLCNALYAQQEHIINLKVEIIPYTSSRDIKAMIFINGAHQLTESADNTASARIFKKLVRGQNDSSIKIKLIFIRPSDYVCLENNPFEYISNGSPRTITFYKRDLAVKNSLQFATELNKSKNFSNSSSILENAMNNVVYDNPTDEIKLRLALSESYFGQQKYQEQLTSLTGINIYNLNSLDSQHQKKYFSQLIQAYCGLFNVDTSLNHPDSIANAIYYNDTFFYKWQNVKQLFLKSALAKKIDRDFFQNSLPGEENIQKQFALFVGRIILPKKENME